MEIPDIKTRLMIKEVLDHYHLIPDKSNRLLCPFHDDKTPSLQVYPKTDEYIGQMGSSSYLMQFTRLETGQLYV